MNKTKRIIHVRVIFYCPFKNEINSISYYRGTFHIGYLEYCLQSDKTRQFWISQIL
jgi:hypothetical protein